MKFYHKVLNDSQKRIFHELGFTKDLGFYLAGGTALALQINHRTSLDFDFYSNDHFDNKKFVKELKKRFGKNLEVDKTQSSDTFLAKIYGVNFSAFYYPYKLVSSLVSLPPVQMASMADISAMKIAAIIQRGKKRDFIDMFSFLN